MDYFVNCPLRIYWGGTCYKVWPLLFEDHKVWDVCSDSKIPVSQSNHKSVEFSNSYGGLQNLRDMIAKSWLQIGQQTFRDMDKFMCKGVVAALEDKIRIYPTVNWLLYCYGKSIHKTLFHTKVKVGTTVWHNPYYSTMIEIYIYIFVSLPNEEAGLVLLCLIFQQVWLKVQQKMQLYFSNKT